jgi:hypothetical protein
MCINPWYPSSSFSRLHRHPTGLRPLLRLARLLGVLGAGAALSLREAGLKVTFHLKYPASEEIQTFELRGSLPPLTWTTGVSFTDGAATVAFPSNLTAWTLEYKVVAQTAKGEDAWRWA